MTPKRMVLLSGTARWSTSNEIVPFPKISAAYGNHRKIRAPSAELAELGGDQRPKTLSRSPQHNLSLCTPTNYPSMNSTFAARVTHLPEVLIVEGDGKPDSHWRQGARRGQLPDGSASWWACSLLQLPWWRMAYWRGLLGIPWWRLLLAKGEGRSRVFDTSLNTARWTRVENSDFV